MMIDNLSDQIDLLNDRVNKNNTNKELLDKLDSLKNDIELIKNRVISEELDSEITKIMDTLQVFYMTPIIEQIMDLDIDEIYTSTLKYEGGYKFVENSKIISDRYKVRLETNFIESDFMVKWRSGDMDIDVSLVDYDKYQFKLTYLPSDESIKLYLPSPNRKLTLYPEVITFSDLSEMVLLIDEYELNSQEFLRTLFPNNEHWELQVIKKDDLRIELIESDSNDVKIIEFDDIKFE